MEPNRASAFLASKPEIGNDREKTTRVELPGNERDRKNRPGRLPIRRRIRAGVAGGSRRSSPAGYVPAGHGKTFPPDHCPAGVRGKLFSKLLHQ